MTHVFDSCESKQGNFIKVVNVNIFLYCAWQRLSDFPVRPGKMSSSLEVKEEIVGKLSEANANEKYLYTRVMELEKRNQKLEKKVNKLKRKKKELKQEVLKLRAKIQGSEEVDEMTGQDEDQGVSKRTLCNLLKSSP